MGRSASVATSPKSSPPRMREASAAIWVLTEMHDSPALGDDDHVL